MANLELQGKQGIHQGFADKNFSWLFPAPSVIIMLVLMAFPIAYTLYLSFTKWSPTSLGSPEIIGLENYITLITDDERFLNALWRTLWFTVAAVGIQTVLGVGLALIFNREFVGRGIVRTIFLMSMVATPVAIALVWMMIMDINTGILNYFLDLVAGIRVGWLNDRKVVLWSMIIIDTWQWTPFIMLITLAGLSALPTEPYESAVIDGASPVQLFWYLTLPMLRPTLMVALMFRSIDALKTFDIIYVITQGGPAFASETLNLYGFSQGFQYFNMGYGSALLILYFMLVMGTSMLFIRLRRTVSEAM
ncbi:MAG: sugar ABC transporter permease [Anaerolineae bacterium]|jgi:multiple sugar transport system permease protein|nr:sugar ABC transporter permease [Anaerolineae bacterium]